ncbi:MerR family transcriptional regulator [Paenibacillus agricola]|uniref:MerR family transcriptional regulator n=1 Tax=Paenibacillus agricola TaxID=2716264 RepID=UPI001FB78C04|nr:MerR family transcriptional regulator [Paenibacillus agricola]
MNGKMLCLSDLVSIQYSVSNEKIIRLRKKQRLLKKGHREQALWVVNLQQYNIQTEKQRIEEIIRLIRKTDFSSYRNILITEEMRIGEVAAIAGVIPSAMEKERLIRSERNPENGYRVFTQRELKKNIIINSLRKTVYSIERMKPLLEA